MTSAGYDLVVVANRLPVDVTLDEEGKPSWTRSPRRPRDRPGAGRAELGRRVGRLGGRSADLDLEPFDADDMRLVPVSLTQDDLTYYYEGFSNDTLWPLYHDVIQPPRRSTGSGGTRTSG